MTIAQRPTLILFTRYPVAGECKTRLIPAVGPDMAASIQRHLTARTVELLRRSECPVIIAITGADKTAFATWLGNDLRYEAQVEGTLSDRLLAFLDTAPVIFFGADTPDLSGHHVQAAIDGLSTHEVVLGPAEDGGYYLIAMREPLPQLLTGMPWSTSEVLPETLRRLEDLGIEPLLLETLADCDRPEDLSRWPELAPCEGAL
ncbi:MAG: TIGR04282 family arsenosugar biosynthesis glycosyltransferase [Pseudomonadota bacterium]